MSALTIGSIAKDGFSVSAAAHGSAIQLKVAGNADMEAASGLDAYLKQLHGDACALGVSEVVFDFSELYFMNSSSFKCFVSWIAQIKKMDPAARYLVRFQSNAQLHWQRRSLEALRAFCPEVVMVEVH